MLIKLNKDLDGRIQFVQVITGQKSIWYANKAEAKKAYNSNSIQFTEPPNQEAVQFLARQTRRKLN